MCKRRAKELAWRKVHFELHGDVVQRLPVLVRCRPVRRLTIAYVTALGTGATP